MSQQHVNSLLLPLLQASLADHRVPDYVAEDPLIKVMGVTREQVVEALQSVGFSDDLLVSLVKLVVISLSYFACTGCSSSQLAG
jgi:hypothetical protein